MPGVKEGRTESPTSVVLSFGAVPNGPEQIVD